ncbi:hypothetical protein NHX12_013048 [Muraenolepis orangiensis]|uniref:RING-type E3 ubiquitin transferase n=1 Tax=Muraenolepis orangiensis TaxID=630683 RepID=A0A9Q0DHC9_9TELE|nr:hypothetical protein NHX12_013048 [Muraenolepis orangiensis]
MTHHRSAMFRNLEQRRMRREAERLRTFQHWPADAPVTPGALAQAGFFYLGTGDKVRCFCCGGTLRHWVHGDCPSLDHRRFFPSCGLMLGGDVGNLPLVVAPGSTDSVDGQLVSQLQRMTVDEQAAAGHAVFPEMEAEDARLTTYNNWPPGASVRPDVLSRAGFFYTGHGDNVKCFFCDGGLRNWEPGDDPWQEHAKWFPRCEFLLRSRGSGYVGNIQEAHLDGSETSMGGSQTPVPRDISSGNDLGGSSALLSPVVQTVLRMGFQAGLVESLVQTKYLLNGQHYTSASDLVTDVLQAEGEERTRGLQSTEPEERTCKVCMDKPVSIVFIPCGHLVVCSDCAASLRHCPICRARIRGSVKAFLS